MNTSTKSTKKKPTQKVKKNKNKKRSLWRRFLSLLFKLFLVFVAVTVMYGIYLDQQIKERIDGNVWELPAAVYGQIIDLEPESEYSLSDVVTLLIGAQYRQQDTQATRPGEFIVSNDAVEIYRRPFTFPDGEEQAFRVRITFYDNRIDRITNLDTGRDFGLLKIDPKLITMMHSPNGEQRLFVPLKAFPDSLIKTLVATEDKRFYDHHGVSLYSIGRAIYVNLTTGRTEGGSTLTQQTVKNLFLTNERSLSRKIREAYMAMILDARYSKERILELYLNEVYFGQAGSEEIHGFPLASLYYFGRPVNELTLDQQAVLVGMVKGASLYNPWTQPKQVLERRNVVLKLTEQQGIIDDELYNLLSQRPLSVLPKGGVISPQPAFMQVVRSELRKQLGDKADHLSGMKIFTTFDPVAQAAAEQSVTNEIEKLRKSTNKDLQTAMVIVSRETGEIRAIIGSAEPRYPGYNRAWLTRRAIGSLAKPSTYLTALGQPDRFQLNTWLDDSPLSIKLDNGSYWQPKNYDRKFRDRVMLVDALALSLNVPTVNLGMALGLDATKNTLQALGVPSDRITNLPSRLLGALELTPLETAQMFQTIANNGQRSPLSILRYVLTDKGELVYQNYPKQIQAVSQQSAYLTTYAMQQVVESGTSRSLKRKYGSFNLAAKTGTSNDSRDSWFTGIDGKNVAVVWIGLDDHSPMKLTGATGALKIYSEYLQNNPPKRLSLPIPQNIYMLSIDDNGQWQCDDRSGRKLPVWTTNTQSLCNNNNQPTPSQQVPTWVTEMLNN
ncbi:MULTISPECIES: bifunctional glycosyl transferase/transpeptidase [unclassified Gilliamella]|uniref:bifunctional glycosyl transferase/transpeptidase n=1 Tax=unclassified Gilliamella TaxID=2685620 RepID=UPI002269BF65|nr:MULTISPECIES: bifunctional glycosyl transferase/transpeptidase [unclassified Gilliamella]MCX8573796.1 bifunctional glycosyl transferase/transpeptidase [Gilliamella sp. B3831]MCX8576026.1 bifunctional glycosyl transferase/transpeptidase [Gilliamella sp. B3815]MCX8590536.1 bifunctional glycosyl transferase/transpeptidase [Gilliamella sp. B3812]MCX8603128.1 bifunctional glycosyl transferase/transpeptidase [Gilliamella sp. B3823]MCX8605309.1 bifunctional glycosyl transferase/transpeptidase [Gil